MNELKEKEERYTNDVRALEIALKFILVLALLISILALIDSLFDYSHSDFLPIKLILKAFVYSEFLIITFTVFRYRRVLVFNEKT